MQSADLGLGTATAALVSDRATRVTHVPFPFGRQPRLLIPRSPAVAAATTMRRYTVPTSITTKSGVLVAEFLARLGAIRLSPGGIALGGAGTFIAHLEDILGQSDLAFAVHLGPPRANRKPVLHIMDEVGRSIAFAKLGINELTCARVRHESDALRQLGEAHLPGLVTPEVIAVGDWQGLSYLVMRPLATENPRMPTVMERTAAQVTLMSAFPRAETSVSDAQWLVRSNALLDSAGDSDDVTRLRKAIDSLLDQHGGRWMTVGACHGDWSRWNMSSAPHGLDVWDWERFATDTPIGWDGLHFSIGIHPNGVAAAIAQPSTLIKESLADLPREDAELMLATYLVYRGVAYVADRQEMAGARTGPLTDWLLPALENLVRS